MGCGEFNPLSDHVRDQESRRAVVFMFDPAAEPQGLPCQLRVLGPCQGNCAPQGGTAAKKDAEDDDPNKPPYRCKVYQEIAKCCPSTSGEELNHGLLTQIPATLEDAQQMPHIFVLDSDDRTIQQSRALASESKASEEGVPEVSFDHLPETHAYTLTCSADAPPYVLFEDVPYERLPHVIKLLGTVVNPPDAGASTADGANNTDSSADSDHCPSMDPTCQA
jgi:hypothetical protein